MYRAYKHMGDVLGACRCMGDVCGHTDVWGYHRGHTDVYRDVERYGGVHMCGSYRHCPDIQTARHTPTCLPTTPWYYISYKI